MGVFFGKKIIQNIKILFFTFKLLVLNFRNQIKNFYKPIHFTYYWTPVIHKILTIILNKILPSKKKKTNSTAQVILTLLIDHPKVSVR